MKTGVARFWEQACREEFKRLPPRLFGGAYGLWIDLPMNLKGDIDNRVKLLSDMMCEAKLKGNATYNFGLAVVKDDKDMQALYVGKLRMEPYRCMATIVILQDWPNYVALRLGV